LELEGEIDIEGQHNQADTAGQRAVPPEASRVSWFARAAPWLVMLLSQTVALSVVIYWSTHSWGFLGALPLAIVLLAGLAAYASWLIAYVLLAGTTWPSRLMMFLVGVGSMLGITTPFFHWERWEGGVIVTEFVLGLTLPVVLLRRRGWRIVLAQSKRQQKPPQPTWQFTLADLLILTSGLAALLGLFVGHHASAAEVFLLIALMLTAPVIVHALLAWRSVWLAIIASMFLALVWTILGMALFGGVSWQHLVESWLLITSPYSATLLISLGWMRAVGYRLRMQGARRLEGSH
jgi:hypothetical protein